MTDQAASPVLSSDRIQSLDLLRGFALLGILIMNITSFSHIGTAYINPLVGAGIDGHNAPIHAFAYLFADMRFMSLFSILFGAGIMLFSNNIKRKNKSAVKYHYKRMFWLLIFGMIHAYLIWLGDILVPYAICGSIVFLMRNLKIRTLAIIAGFFFVIPTALSLLTYFGAPQETLESSFAFWTPTQEAIDSETSAYLGSYLDQMPQRVNDAIFLQTFLFLTEQMWRILSMMILGMILFKKDIITAQRDKSFYKKMFISFFSFGLLLSAVGLARSYSKEWDGIWVMNIGHHYNYIASAFMALGYLAFIMLWSQSDLFGKLQSRLKAVGRLAFTNYILTSVLCITIFYGHGLGLFGQLDRLEQWFVIILVWMILLAISQPILKKYEKGPLEALWRKLTYGWR